MSTIELENKRLALLGLGVENRGLATYLSSIGLSFSVCDERQPGERAAAGTGALAIDEWRLGPGCLNHLDDFDIVFRTPGLPAGNPQLQVASQAGTQISSQTALFFDRCPAPILGITGTKGKGTTASLAALMLQADSAYDSVKLGGNIGIPPVEFLPQLSARDLVVLELSSFQLQDLQASPSIAVVLNLLTDHLDYHANRQEYVEAKQSIYRHQRRDDWLIINADSNETAALASMSAASTLSFSIEGEVTAGAWVEDEAIFHRAPQGQAEQVCGLESIALHGSHNLANVAAATTAALAAGGSVAGAAQGLREFSGLPYRLQKVAQREGISFYNDSAATTPDAAIAAIRSFDAPILLIAGGASKGAQFGEFARAIATSPVRVLILMGQERERIAAEVAKTASFSGEVVSVEHGMKEAVAAALLRGRQGDVVLLSPGCASFGLFDNYVARGSAFSELVSATEQR